MLTIKNDEFETERLYFRPLVESDSKLLQPMYTNQEVMKYIYDGSVFTDNTTQEKVKNFEQHWKQHGFGMWILIEKTNQQVIGYAGFRYFEDGTNEFHNQIELGYIIDQPHWGKGYAKEAIKACVQVGIQHYNLQRILATILPENIASQKVACYAGLLYAFDAKFDGLLHQIYEIVA